MKQVLQHLRTAEIEIADLPCPQPGMRSLLIQTRASLISSGTERMAVNLGRKSLIGKAKERPDLVRQVLQKMRTEGVLPTLQKVKGRLDTPLALGYSSSGIVMEVGEGLDDFKVGDRVACAGGGYASHAEYVYVPKNLAAKVPEDVDLESAAFSTLGAIALHGVRIAGVSLGDKVAVIGLGLLGQLAVQILKAAGCEVLGIDMNPDRVKLALERGVRVGAVRGQDDVLRISEEFSKGQGVDAVIITAGTSSNDPIELAGEIARDRAVISVIGAVRMDIPRKLYYEKELQVRVSRSYGPGRYDRNYEEKGIDYPIGYVRWTEKRNMEAFLELLSQGKVEVKSLITHKFPIDRAKEAYDLILGKTKERFLAVLFDYPEAEEEKVERKIFLASKKTLPKETINMGLIGAGNFAKAVLLPSLKKVSGVNFKTLATATGISARHRGEKFGFEYITTDYRELLDDPEITAVLIATRHNLHAKMAMEALERNKYVFVEKPLATSPEELERLIEVWNSSETGLMVGFNRRFSLFSEKLKEFFSKRTTPLIMNYRINAGYIPKEHWVQNSEEGGGRIIGEVCHFVDLLEYFAGSPPASVYTEAISANTGSIVSQDNVNITLRFEDGSLGSISYVALGDKSFPKERIEVFGESSVAVIEDFKTASFYRNGRKRVSKKLFQDKGHRAELERFFEAIHKGKPLPIDFRELVMTTLTTFRVLDSLRLGKPVAVDLKTKGDE